MKSFYIIANLKANLDFQKSLQWIDAFTNKYRALPGVEVILAPSFLSLNIFHQKISHQKNLSIASQDVSVFTSGAHTGEIPASHLAQYCKYALIGHNERRLMTFQQQNFHYETDAIIDQKTILSLESGMKPIICFSDQKSINDKIIDSNILYAYEPISAIGTGNHADINSIKKIYFEVSSIAPKGLIYGGSVDEKNVKLYLTEEYINGVIVGTAAIEVDRFIDILDCVHYLIKSS